MKILLFTLFISISSALVNTSQGSLLIEPHIGFNLSGSGDTTVSGVKTENTYSGPQYGLRAGFQYLGFMTGLAYNLSSYDLEKKSSGTTTKDKFDRSEVGVFAGYNLPILLRGWAAYYFSNKAEDQEAAGATVKGAEYSGHTLELGVGYTGLPFLSINFLYRNSVYDKLKSGATTTNLTGSSELSTSEFVLGVSFPITLL